MGVGHAPSLTICFIAVSQTTKLCQGNGFFTRHQLDQFIAMRANSCHPKSMHLSADSVIGNIQRGLVITKRAQNTDKTCFLYCTGLITHAEWTLLLPDSVRQNSSTGKKVLRRVVAVIKFMGARGLPFRGDNELLGSAHNGNYLGLLELIAEFDPFLKEHIEKHGNKGRGKPSYLSSTVCEEFISLMGDKTQKVIAEEIRHAKYFSVIVDSSPDLAHVEQLTFVFRFVSADGRIVAGRHGIFFYCSLC